MLQENMSLFGNTGGIRAVHGQHDEEQRPNFESSVQGDLMFYFEIKDTYSTRRSSC